VFTLSRVLVAACVAFLIVGRAGIAADVAVAPGDAAWPLTGRDPEGSYYSPLATINAATVERLGFAWQFPIGGHHTLESTPIVVDGVLYASGNWGTVVALDAANGRLLWRFDPYADGSVPRRPFGNIVNRGVVLASGKAYVIAYDCRVFALDARSGTPIWTVDSKEDSRYFCTGAPLVAGDVLVVGDSGSDVSPGGLRGYVSAYDLVTGTRRWRTYMVPRLDDPQPSEALAAAAATWDPARDARFGGGGTPWNALTYDASLQHILVGTGNAAPYISAREKEGRPLDRLYASSILALDVHSGRILWYYQTTPGDVWDYDAAAPFVLADLTIAGRRHRTLLQANKNGYFYVLDRETGTPLSGGAFAYQSWSSGLDARFRPIVPPGADNGVRWHLFYPGTLGAHAWEPMAYSPKTGLVYIPTVDTPMATPRRLARGVLKAWDPVHQRLVWEHQTAPDQLVRQGGVLATGGGLVISGREDGRILAYAAATGRILKTIETGAATLAAPMTYALNGEQFIAVMQGAGDHYTYALEGAGASQYLNDGRLLVLRLGGAAVPPPASPAPTAVHARAPEARRPPDVVAAGAALFEKWCTRCHGVETNGVAAGGGAEGRIPVATDLATRESFAAIVLEGALVPRGMPRFDDVLSIGDAELIRAYLSAINPPAGAVEPTRVPPP
jgi:quinohemoprotein ethanol dehydrogenase